MANINDPHHIKVTIEDVKNMKSQRPDIFANLPPLEFIDNSWNLIVYEDEDANALHALDRTVFVEPTAPVPEQVEMFRARYIMQKTPKDDTNLWDAAMAIVNQLPTNEKDLVLAAMEYGNVLNRHGTFVSSLGPMLGLSDEEIDNLFKAADALDL